MRWERGRRSDNVIESAGAGGRGVRLGGGKMGLGGIAIIVAVGLLMGQDPLQILGNVLTQSMGSAQVASTQPTGPVASDEEKAFVSSILGDTEDTWSQIFASQGAQYPAPKLVLFKGAVNSACGTASSAVGPFYCPADQRVYLDTGFFDELANRFKAAGDFAQAYVIAHEVGHHIQTVTGISQQVNQARQQGKNVEGANGLLVRQELQADCYAGVWAHHAQKRHDWMEAGDLEEALNAAHVIGDDNLQKKTQGRVVPDSFTHGTSEQRSRWFRVGFDAGEMKRCDTFQARSL